MRALLWMCVAWVVACGDACGDDFDPASRVSELRLLAVQADHPFALPGQTVQLSGLAFDPEQRWLSWGWGVCVDPNSTVALDCLRALSFDDLSIGTERHALVVPETNALYVGVVVMVCPGSIMPGTALGIPVSCVDGSGLPVPLAEFEIGLKRIFVRDPAQNENPTIAELRWDGAPWPEGERKMDSCLKTEAGACTRWTEHSFELSAPGAVEASVDRDGKAIEEQAVVQFYATGGTFEDDVRVVSSAKSKWHARREDEHKLITLWFVVRDDRGGVSWISRELQVP